MKIKEIWLMGGLGNVFFQILVGEIFTQKGYNVKYIDILCNSNFLTKYILKWKIHDPEYLRFVGNRKIEKANFYTLVWRIFNFGLSKIFRIPVNNHVWDKYSTTSYFYLGYFQNNEILLNNFYLINSLAREWSSCLPKVRIIQKAIHFRGRDSLFRNQNENFLLNAIKSHPDLVIITDHVELAKVLAPNNEVISFSVIEDFALLVSVEGILFISDSTFSLWAALFNLNSKIFAPISLVNTFGNLNFKIESFSNE